MQRFEVTGVDCAARAARVEKAVAAVPGVSTVSVNLLTGILQVEFSAPATGQAVCRAAEAAGCTARPAGGDAAAAGIPRLKRQLIASLCLLVPLLYLSVGRAAGLPLPAFLTGDGTGGLWSVLVQLALSLAVCWVNRPVFAVGLRQFRSLFPGAEALVSLGVALTLACGLLALGSPGGQSPDFSFVSAAAVLAVSAAAALLAAHLRRRAIRMLLDREKAVPQTATVVREGKAVKVPAEELHPGDIFLVRPSGSLPADGVVVEGRSRLDESALTGVSAPVDKVPGDAVNAAAVNRDAALACRATRVGRDTTLARSARLALGAAGSGAPLPAAHGKAAALLAPAVFAVAAVVLAVRLLLGQPLPAALGHAAAVLIAGCPCALAVAAQAPLAAGCLAGACRGILYRSAGGLLAAGDIDTVALDMAGTITAGEPGVVEIVGTRNVPAKFLLGLAAGLEARSDHPLAKAILKKADADGVKYRPAADFQAVPGSGLLGKVAGKVMAGGSEEFIRTQCALPDDLAEAGRRMLDSGVTPLYFALDRHAAGVIGVADAVRRSSRQAVAQMRALGLRVVLLTGDTPSAAGRIAPLVGLDAGDVQAGICPDGMPDAVRRLQAAGRTAMAGGSAEALACAGVGVAMGAGTVPPPRAAAVVLVRSDLTDLAAAVRLSRQAAANRRLGLALAWCCTAVCLLLAAVGLLPGPASAAACSVLAAVCAAAGALRPYRQDEGHTGREQP